MKEDAYFLVPLLCWIVTFWICMYIYYACTCGGAFIRSKDPSSIPS